MSSTIRNTIFQATINRARVRRRKRQSTKPTRRPRLEFLEDRSLLTAVDFVPAPPVDNYRYSPDVAIANIDGIGPSDIVSINPEAQLVNVSFATGGGNFDNAIPVASLETQPLALDVGDFDRDGDIDIVIAGAGNVLYVLSNNGFGSYSEGITTIDLGRDNSIVQAGDVNADGLIDLVVWPGSSVSALLGDGDGGFSTPIYSDVEIDSNGPTAIGGSVAIGDFNNDGHADLATTYQESGSVFSGYAVFVVGDGSGSFGTPVRVFLRTAWPEGIAVADFNDDGNLDWATVGYDQVRNFERQERYLEVGLGNGSMGFNRSDRIIGSGTRGDLSAWGSVAIGDLNSDGKLDIAVANDSADQVTVVLGDGAGNFGAATDFPVGSTPRPITVGDVNGDDHVDIVTSNAGSGTLSVLLNAIPRITAFDYYVTEGDVGTTDLRITVEKALPNNFAVSVDYETINDPAPLIITPATPGVDFLSTSGTLTFLPGETTHFITVPVIGDLLDESDEFFGVELSNLAWGEILGSTRVILLDDDEPANQPPQAEANGPYTVGEGGSVSLSSAGSTDSDGSIALFEWDFDYDGSTFTADATGASPTFSAAGLDGPSTRTVALRVTDDDGGADLDTATLVVANVVPTVDAGDGASIGQGDTFSSSGSFNDPGPDSWTGTVNYGDGTGTQALALNPDKSFDLAHVYADAGTYVVYVAINDGDGGIGLGSATVTVINDPPKAEANGPYSVEEGSDVTLSIAGSTDSDGSIVSFQWDFNYDGVSFDVDAQGPSPTFSAVGLDGPSTRTVALRVTDDDGDVSIDTASVDVANVAPTVSAGADAQIAQGGTFSANGFFADPGPDTWTASVDYGDGSGDQTLALNADKTFDLSHAYATAGDYTVTVTVNDGDGGIGTDTVLVTVVAPSTVQSVVLNDGSAQRSTITSITVRFSGVVTLEPNAFELLHNGVDFVALSVSATNVNDQTVAVLTFAGPEIIGGSLADGDYRLTIRGDRVKDSLGQQLDGDGNGIAGGNHVLSFARLFGDTDGDGDVDKADREIFKGSLGSFAGDAAYVWYLDFDGDGQIGQTDRKEFNQRFESTDGSSPRGGGRR